MANEDNIEMFKKAYQKDDEIADGHFPRYFVSQPPHRDHLTPVYYKMVTPHGPGQVNNMLLTSDPQTFYVRSPFVVIWV